VRKTEQNITLKTINTSGKSLQAYCYHSLSLFQRIKILIRKLLSLFYLNYVNPTEKKHGCFDICRLVKAFLSLMIFRKQKKKKNHPKTFLISMNQNKAKLKEKNVSSLLMIFGFLLLNTFFFKKNNKKLAGVISLLDEPEEQLKVYALSKLDALVDQFWAEIADAVLKM